MAYEDGDTASRLAAVRVAIGKCLGSQEFSIGDRRQRTAELAQLRAIEKDLEAQLALESDASGGFSLVQIDSPI